MFAYVHSHDRGEPGPRRQPWEPNWRMWAWLALALVLGYASTLVQGAAGAGLVLVTFTAACKAAAVGLPYGTGLSEWRQ